MTEVAFKAAQKFWNNGLKEHSRNSDLIDPGSFEEFIVRFMYLVGILLFLVIVML